jgi:hypothetical protein
MGKLIAMLSLTIVLMALTVSMAGADGNATANNTNSTITSSSVQQQTIASSSNQMTPSQTAAADTKGQFRVGPTVRLRPLNSEINKSADGLVELFLNNPSLNDVTFEVDMSVDVPSDIYIYAADGGMAGGAGAVTGHFTVPPGSARTITLHIKGAKTGTFNVHFGGMYWPGDNKDKWNPLSLDNSFAVEENSTPTPATTSKPLPGFEAESLVLVFMILFFVRRK